jgi:hypothetical protein
VLNLRKKGIKLKDLVEKSFVVGKVNQAPTVFDKEHEIGSGVW